MTPTTSTATLEITADVNKILAEAENIAENVMPEESADFASKPVSEPEVPEAMGKVAENIEGIAEEKARQMTELKSRISDYSQIFVENQTDVNHYVDHLVKYSRHVIKEKHHYLFSRNHNLTVAMDVIKETLKSNPHLVGTLKLFEETDEKVLRHSLGTMAVSILIGHSAGYNRKKLCTIAKASGLHDTAKLLPYINAVINKPTKDLEPEEWGIIYEHAQKSHVAVGAISKYEHPNDHEVISESALRHHIHYDKNKGYPPGLPFISDQDLIEQIDVVSLADAYDAMRARKDERPYKGDDDLEFGPGQKDEKLQFALSQVKTFSGSQFNPDLADKLIDLHGEFLAENSNPTQQKAAETKIYQFPAAENYGSAADQKKAASAAIFTANSSMDYVSAKNEQPSDKVVVSMNPSINQAHVLQLEKAELSYATRP